MKTNERRLLMAIADEQATGPRVRTICAEMGNCKQNWYYLQKWCSRQWYDYGVSLDLGWLTENGMERARDAQKVE